MAMNLQMLTLNIPEPLYDQLKQRASENQRTIEAETLDVLAVHVPVVKELPDALASALANIGSLDDEALWRAARSRLSDDEAAQLEELHFKEQSEDLSAEESNLKAALMQQ